MLYIVESQKQKHLGNPIYKPCITLYVLKENGFLNENLYMCIFGCIVGKIIQLS